MDYANPGSRETKHQKVASMSRELEQGIEQDKRHLVPAKPRVLDTSEGLAYEGWGPAQDAGSCRFA